MWFDGIADLYLLSVKATNPDKICEQEQFKKDDLEPRLAEAKAGSVLFFFVDAAHFVHGAFLGRLFPE
jgi:hypothetical protein